MSSRPRVIPDGAQATLAVSGPGALPDSLPPAARALFRKPVVAVHPGVGAIMRQWMPEYFATVIDLLMEKNQLNVVLVGGPDEADLAERGAGARGQPAKRRVAGGADVAWRN